MTAVAAIAGPLEAGTRVGIELPQAGARAAQVAACDGKTLMLELLEELPTGTLEEGSVIDLTMSLSWGMYKWLCLVCSQPSERKAEIQLLDAPMFIQRRLDPRVGVGVPADIRTVRSAVLGQPHEAIVADLSHGGLKLEAAKQLRAGDVIEVTIGSFGHAHYVFRENLAHGPCRHGLSLNPHRGNRQYRCPRLLHGRTAQSN